jgi:hypothetical protein
MPRGGARVGAGRKPKTPRQTMTAANIVAIDSARSDELVTATPPKDLPGPQQPFWRAYAKRALEAGTLTLQTEPAFRLLCELEAEKAATKETLDRDGRTYLDVVIDGSGQEHNAVKAHPLTTSYRQLAQRVELLMARFSLAPFGKPVAGAGGKKKPAVSPWLAITAAAKNGRA